MTTCVLIGQEIRKIEDLFSLRRFQNFSTRFLEIRKNQNFIFGTSNKKSEIFLDFDASKNSSH
jgi:hypothetical protein